MNWHDILAALALPAAILLFTAAYAVLNWALTQKSVKNNTALTTILTLLDHTAEAIVASLRTLPSTANRSDIVNDIIEQAISEFASKNTALVKSAGVSKDTLSDYMKNRVCVSSEMNDPKSVVVPSAIKASFKG